ncbi:MAG: HAMP domain-containing sensor histidine kinase [Bdellovibrionia bacterium]
MWPKSQTEMAALIEAIGAALEVEFVGIHSGQNIGESKGLKFFRTASAENSNRQNCFDILRNRYQKVLCQDNYMRHFHVSEGELKWPSLSVIVHLTEIPLIELESRQEKKCTGLILIGSVQPLSPEQEQGLSLIALWLSAITQISVLETAVEIRNQFLSIASHELKTPLTSIYGILQLQERMLRQKSGGPTFPDQERQHGFLKMVIRQVERLNELIDGLLDVSKIQNGRFTVEPSETDVSALLKDCIQSRLNVIAEEASVKLDLGAPPSLNAFVDPVRTEEVISNLVMNAIRFSPEGGVVWIRLKDEGDSFRLIVRDQGPGIDLEDRERIFRPFQRVQRSSRLGGLGLGLYISRQIAQLHGGDVSLVESLPGKGNVFEAHFPIRRAHLAAVA